LVRLTSVRSANSVAAGASASWTEASSSRQTTINELALTASATVVARVTPVRSGARPGVRFQTVVGWPAAVKARARAVPIAPRPRTVTGVFMGPSLTETV
jgi:hypothetical protein